MTNPAAARPGRSLAERGSVTAELAVALPAVVLLLAMLLLGGSAGVLQLRLEESARAAARALARGETPAEAENIAVSIAGPSAAVSIGSGSSLVHVTVEARMGGALAALMPWPLSASAAARLESTPAAVAATVGAPDMAAMAQVSTAWVPPAALAPRPLGTVGPGGSP